MAKVVDSRQNFVELYRSSGFGIPILQKKWIADSNSTKVVEYQL
jgi:hypothetical protein